MELYGIFDRGRGKTGRTKFEFTPWTCLHDRLNDRRTSVSVTTVGDKIKITFKCCQLLKLSSLHRTANKMY